MHISQISQERVEDVNRYLSEGEEVLVKCTDLDAEGGSNSALRKSLRKKRPSLPDESADSLIEKPGPVPGFFMGQTVLPGSAIHRFPAALISAGMSPELQLPSLKFEQNQALEILEAEDMLPAPILVESGVDRY